MNENTPEKRSTRRTFNRSAGVLLGSAVAYGLGLGGSTGEQGKSVRIKGAVFADDQVVRQDSAEAESMQGRSAQERYQALGINVSEKRGYQDDIQYVFTEEQLQAQLSTVPKVEEQPYFAEPFDGDDAPDGIDIISQPEVARPSLFGRFFARTSKIAYAASTPRFEPARIYPDMNGNWIPMFPEATRHDKNNPELQRPGGGPHKYDVLMRDKRVGYGEYVAEQGSIDGLWGNKGDAPTRAHADYIYEINREATPKNRLAVQGYCYQKAKESVDTRPKLMPDYLYLPTPPKGVGLANAALRTFKLEDGSTLALTLNDVTEWFGLIGSVDTMVPVPINSALALIRRGRMLMVATQGRSWGRAVVAVSEDGLQIKTRGIGEPDRLFRLDQIDDLFVDRSYGVHRDGKAIVGGEMNNEQIVARQSFLYRSVWPQAMYHFAFGLPKPPIEEFLAWRARLRSPDVRMVYGGF